MSEFEAYRLLRDAGIEATGAYLLAKKNGLSTIESVRMLRSIYELGLVEAKTQIVRADGQGTSLEEYQASLLPSLARLLDGE